MARLGVRTALLSAILGLSACHSCPAPGNPGFYPLEEAKDRPFVANCARAVYRLANSYASGSGQRTMLLSAFVMGEPDLLWTNRHGFPGLEKNQVGDFTEFYEGQSLDFVLFDHRGVIVFDTKNALDHAEVVRSGNPGGFAGLDERLPFVVRVSASDYLCVRLSRPLSGAVLRASEREARPGLPVVALGFPAATESRHAIYHRPDADGRSLRFTHGRVTEAPVGNGLTWRGKKVSFSGRSFGSQLFLTSADCASGMSGAPVLDEEGRVLGMISVSFSQAACPGFERAAAIRISTLRRLAGALLVEPSGD